MYSEAMKHNSIDSSSVMNQGKYRRPVDHRIYVNRTVNLNNIEYFGFDMDYTV